jgi:LPS sulfotransferase NodH
MREAAATACCALPFEASWLRPEGDVSMQHEVIPKDSHANEIESHFEGRIESGMPRPSLNRLTLVCFTNRCGSTLVCSALSRLGIAGKPQRLNYEYFNSDVVTEESAGLGIRTFDDYVHHCIRLYSSPTGNFTTKLSATQLNWFVECGAIARLGVRPKVIFVRRRNVIAQAVSFATAVQNGEWTSLHAPNPDSASLRLDPCFVLIAAKAICEQNAIFELLFDFHDLKPMTVWYEDIAADQTTLVSDLADFLGLNSPSLGRSTLPVARQTAEHKAQWEAEIRARGRIDYRIGA